MGAWAEGAFGNDTAADWSGNAGEAGTLDYVHDTMKAVVTSTEYLDSYYADQAIAAASVTAWLNNQPTKELSQPNPYAENATTALSKFKGTDAAKALIPLALQVIARVTDPKDNEAWELWFEDEPASEEHDWLKSLREIEACLKAAA